MLKEKRDDLKGFLYDGDIERSLAHIAVSVDVRTSLKENLTTEKSFLRAITCSGVSPSESDEFTETFASPSSAGKRTFETDARMASWSRSVMFGVG